MVVRLWSRARCSIVILFINIIVTVSGCKKTYSKNEAMISAKGILVYYPEDVQSEQSWYGHNYIVGATPIQPTIRVTESTIKALIGKNVLVTGYWNPGRAWKPTEEKMNLPMPEDKDEPIIRGDGIMIEKIFIITE
ncbi:MAG: hypothetical protein V1872_10980 [bacterium]